MKVIFDTNIWVSSLLLPKGIPGQIVKAWQQGSFQVITCQYILDEIKKVLNYPRIQKRLSISQTEIEEYLSLLRFFSEFFEFSPTASYEELRDINDGPILETLIKSQANYLVTGDQDLLVLGKEYSIITASQFMQLLT